MSWKQRFWDWFLVWSGLEEALLRREGGRQLFTDEQREAFVLKRRLHRNGGRANA
jgi:hypothetical protein